MVKKAVEAEVRAHVSVAPPKFGRAEFRIRGVSPLVQNKFAAKAREQMHDQQKLGHQGKKGKKRDPKDFDALYEGAKHIAEDGWNGIPCTAFRGALISACRLVGFKMTIAKLSVFIEPDGFDRTDRTPLVKITKGEPEYFEAPVRNETGVIDLRARPMWAPGWEATVTIRFDEDVFSLHDVSNLLLRAGMQVGIQEGRHDSRKSTGQGWGEFTLVEGEN